MESAIDSSVGIVAYLALFAGVGFVFVFVNLFIGRFLRPSNPYKEKLEIYECGEPTIGSSFVQFDLRFYVVALVFIIFDVEVAFLFPWATVFGKAANLYHDKNVEIVAVDETTGEAALTPVANAAYRELGIWTPEITMEGTASELNAMVRDGLPARSGEGVTTPLSWLEQFDSLEMAGLSQIMAVAAIAAGIFFVVLLVGFAYEWRTGALDWVRATEAAPAAVERRSARSASSQESVLSA